MNRSAPAGDWTIVVSDDGTEDSDEVLVLRAQLGDRAALAALITRWDQPIRTFCRYQAVHRQTTDDLVQDTWVAVLRSLAGLRQADRFRPWLFTIARRTAADHLRRHYRRPPSRGHDISDEDSPDSTTIDDMADAEIDRQLVVDLIGRLADREREVVALHYLLDIDIAETAVIVGVPAGTVKSRLARARRQMAAATIDHRDLPEGTR